MRSESAKRILSKITDGTKQKVKELTDKIIAMSEENKTAEEQLIRDLIDKYMNFKSGAESTSIQHYGEYGAVSGSLFLNVKAMMREFANHQLTQQQSANAELKKQNGELVEVLTTLTDSNLFSNIVHLNARAGGKKKLAEAWEKALKLLSKHTT